MNVIAGVRAGLELAAADPAAAKLLVIDAPADPDGVEFHRQMIDHLAERLRAAAGRQCSSAAQEQSLILGVLGMVTIRLTLDQAKTLPTVTLEAAEFLFAPYLGDEPAQRLIAAAIDLSLSGRS